MTGPPATASSPASPAQAPDGIGPLEAEQDTGVYDDNDSACGVGSDVSDTTSLAESVKEFRQQYGRTYHSFRDRTGSSNEYIPYFFPNDAAENDRLDLQHNCLVKMQRGLISSPAGRDKPLKRVLDIGTGTGMWAMDFADMHPESFVIGVDISPIQPRFTAPNVEFQCDDVEMDWTFSSGFDLIYIRYMTGSIKDWPKLFRQAYQFLNPGGWIEVLDAVTSHLRSDDGTLDPNSDIVKWTNLSVEASTKLGCSLDSAIHYEEQMQAAGFKDIQKVSYKWPMNSWPKDPHYKELGHWVHSIVQDGVEGISYLSFTNVLGWTEDEINEFLPKVKQSHKNRRMHGYWPVYAFYCQKPEEA